MMALLWVGLGGFLGANARYLLGGVIASRFGTAFPLGTFIINITGSFLLGLFLAYAEPRQWLGPSWRLLIAVGFMGAYTTFSTFTYESFRLMQSGEYLLATLNLGGSLVTGLLAVFAGVVAGSLI